MPSQCSAPAAAPTATSTVTVTVPTNVNTNINPQISPNLIQQQQPQNSPVTAGTRQDTTGGNIVPTPSSPNYPVSAPPDTSLTEAIAALAKQQAAQAAEFSASQAAALKAQQDREEAAQKAQQDQMDAYLKAQAGVQQAAPAQQMTTQYVPSPGDAGLPEDLSMQVNTQTPVVVKPKTSYLPFILAGVALLVLTGSGKQGNRHVR